MQIREVEQRASEKQFLGGGPARASHLCGSAHRPRPSGATRPEYLPRHYFLESSPFVVVRSLVPPLPLEPLVPLGWCRWITKSMGERDRPCEQQNTNGEGEARERKYMRFMIDDDDSLSLLPAFRPFVLPHVQNLITCGVTGRSCVIPGWSSSYENSYLLVISISGKNQINIDIY